MHHGEHPTLLIAYCGALWEGSTAKMRADALRDLGHTVLEVDTTCTHGKLYSAWARCARKAGWAVDSCGANRALLQLTERHSIDLIWIDKGLTVQPDTLRRLREVAPSVRLIHFSLDDMQGRHNQSRAYLAGISLYASTRDDEVLQRG